LETLKNYEFKTPDLIQEKTPTRFSKLSSVLTKIKSLNKTDVVALVANFGVSTKKTPTLQFISVLTF